MGWLGHGIVSGSAFIIRIVFVVFTRVLLLGLSLGFLSRGFICILRFRAMKSAMFALALARLPVMRINFMLASCIIIH